MKLSIFLYLLVVCALSAEPLPVDKIIRAEIHAWYSEVIQIPIVREVKYGSALDRSTLLIFKQLEFEVADLDHEALLKEFRYILNQHAGKLEPSFPFETFPIVGVLSIQTFSVQIDAKADEPASAFRARLIYEMPGEVFLETLDGNPLGSFYSPQYCRYVVELISLIEPGSYNKLKEHYLDKLEQPELTPDASIKNNAAESRESPAPKH